MTNIIARSLIPTENDYSNYREALRVDFWFSCAYCTITEIEAAAIGFCIDHYEPQSRSPALITAYSNLMWSCQRCNSQKGDYPEPSHADLGYRFIRVDKDDYFEHFEPNDFLLTPLTPIGKYTHAVLYLDAAYLRRIRELRKRFLESSEAVAGGLRFLRSVPIDRLPSNVRGKFLSVRNQISNRAETERAELEGILRDMARSENLDIDPGKSNHAKVRRLFLKDLGANFNIALEPPA